MPNRIVSERQYVAALESLLERGVADSVRQMLAAHASAPGRVATFRSLGLAAGFSQPNTNRIYGQFAGRMRRELRLPPPQIEIETIATMPGPPIDAAEEFSFRMRPAFARALTRLNLATARSKRRLSPTIASSNRNSEGLYEGTIYRSQITGWERNREARRQCIAHFGLACQACNFSFAKRYSVLGASFIEVHHTTRYAGEQGRRKVDPLVDLVPVCSNCHRMLHRRNPPLGVRALRKILGRDV